MRPTLLIADDDPVVCSMLSMSLEQRFEIVAAVDDGEQAVARAAAVQPDAAVVDVQMPAGGGSRAVRGIAEASPDTAIVVLSGRRDRHRGPRPGPGGRNGVRPQGHRGPRPDRDARERDARSPRVRLSRVRGQGDGPSSDAARARDGERGLRRLVAGAFMVLALGLAGVFLAIALGVRGAAARRRRAAIPRRVALTAADSLERSVVDLETGVRGYLLTDQPLFLEPYRQALLDIPAGAVLAPGPGRPTTRGQTARVDRLDGLDPRLRARLTRLRSPPAPLDRSRARDGRADQPGQAAA